MKKNIKNNNTLHVPPRNPEWRGTVNTVDLLKLTNSDQRSAAFHPETILFFYYKKTITMRRSTVLSLPLYQEFPETIIPPITPDVS